MDLCPAVGEVISERERKKKRKGEKVRGRERGEKNFLQKGGSSGDTWAWQSGYLSN